MTTESEKLRPEKEPQGVAAAQLDRDAERDAVVAALRLLPRRLRTKQLASLLAETMRDADLRRDFRSRPLDYFKAMDMRTPKGVKLDIHEVREDTLHLVLPHPIMAAREIEVEGQVSLSDEDLVSAAQAAAAAASGSDFYNTGNWLRDPNTTRDAKRDLGSGPGSDVWDYFFEDKDPTPADRGD